MTDDNDNAAPPLAAATPQPIAAQSTALKFTGQAGEYFRIWIVNVCLSIVTLGIYSAWAKVRRKRYFYGNTILNDAGFEYLANPETILKGRVIVLVALMFISALDKGTGSVGIGALAYLIALPFVVILAARFNARNSAHRHVRFHFGNGFKPPAGLSKRFVTGYRETSQFLILPVFLLTLSLGLLGPYYSFRKRQFFLEHSAYGTTPFSFDARAGQYYLAWLKIVLMLLLCVAGMVVTVGVGVLPLYILFASYRDGTIARLQWKHTHLGVLNFDCNWKTWDLFKLHFLNSLAVIFTLGLMSPWAAIRTARYQLQGIAVGPSDAIAGFTAAAEQQAAATGDEAGELLGFDFGL